MQSTELPERWKLKLQQYLIAKGSTKSSSGVYVRNSDMKAYSHDLQKRMAACNELGAKIYQVASRLFVSLAFINSLLRRQRTTGSVAELPRHPGPAPRLDAAGDQRLLACQRAQPDVTLAEIG